MDPHIFAEHMSRKSPCRPLRIAAWLGRKGFFIAAWSLWEQYSRELCDHLPAKPGKGKGDSHVDWVKKSMAANGLAFAGEEWFGSANCLRNLLAYFGGRAAEPRAQRLLERSRTAFPGIYTCTDAYVAIDHCDVADLELRIEDFIRDTWQHAPAADAASPGVFAA